MLISFYNRWFQVHQIICLDWVELIGFIFSYAWVMGDVEATILLEGPTAIVDDLSGLQQQALFQLFEPLHTVCPLFDQLITGCGRLREMVVLELEDVRLEVLGC